MADRPWTEAERAASLIERSGVLRDPTTSAASVDEVTVEFGVAPARPWEREARLIRSSMAIAPDGVYELSVRLPETDTGMSSFQARKAIEAALEDALDSGQFPDRLDWQVRGGQEGWNPHIVYGGDMRSRYYPDGADQDLLTARRAVSLAEDAVQAFRDRMAQEVS